MPVKSLLNLWGDRLYTLPLIVLYLTDGCNSRCVSCDIWRNPRRNMPMTLVQQIVDACDDLGVRWVLLSGGEAMQHPQWPQIARLFRQRGIYVMLLTNGLLVQKQADELIDTVDELIVSLDGGTASTYAAIRGLDAFELVLSGIQSARQLSVPVITRTTVQRGNFREIPTIIDIALKYNVNRASFLAVDVGNPFAFGTRFESESHSLASDLALTTAEVDELEHILGVLETDYAVAFESGHIAESPQKLRRILVDYFRALLGHGDFPRPRCNAPHFSTIIEVDGTLRPCYFLPAYGRLKPRDAHSGDGHLAVPLAEAINSDTAQALRAAYRKGQRHECKSCVCPLYKGPRALLRW